MENDIIIELLNDFLLKTKEKRIPWVFLNPNAVRWTKSTTPTPTIVTLQKQMTPVVITGVATTQEVYVFTVQSPPNTSIQITTSAEKQLTGVLKDLFKEAMISANDKTVETLKNLLRGI